MPGFQPRSFNDALRTRETGKEWSRGLEGPTVGGVGLGTKMTAKRWKRQSTGTDNSVPPPFVEEVANNTGNAETWLRLFRENTAEGRIFAGLPEVSEPTIAEPAPKEEG